MRDLTPFERRLSHRLHAELGAQLRPVDVAAVAAAAIAAGGGRRRSLASRIADQLAIGPLPARPAMRGAMLLATVAMVTLATVALLLVVSGASSDRLAFIRTNGDVVVARADGSHERVLLRVSPPVLFTQIEWAPDGRHLAIVDEELRLTILSAAGAVTFQGTMALGTSRFEWSPDGRQLAIADGPWLPIDDEACGGPIVHPELKVMAPDGTVTWSATLPPDFRYTAGLGELTWSPGVDRIAIVGTTLPCDRVDQTLPLGIWLADVGQTSSRALTPGKPGDIDFQPVWLPDGRLLFSRRSSGLMEVDPATAATSLFLASEAMCETCAGSQVRIEDQSPDGSRLALRQAGLEPIVLDLASGAVTVVRPERTGFGFIAPLAWAPSGRELLVDLGPALEGPVAVVAVDVATGRVRDLLADTRFFAVLD